jgi:hypothetical protein
MGKKGHESQRTWNHKRYLTSKGIIPPPEYKHNVEEALKAAGL